MVATLSDNSYNEVEATYGTLTSSGTSGSIGIGSAGNNNGRGGWENPGAGGWIPMQTPPPQVVPLAVPDPRYATWEISRPEEARVNPVVKTKKKVKVIDAVVDATDEKVKRLKEKIKRHDTQLQMEEKELKTRAQHINTIKTLKKNLESKSEILSKKTKAELKAHYQSIIDRLTKEALIEKFDTDMYQRVIITTKPILVKGVGWSLPKDAGVYQIRIDFNIEDWKQAIKILNITQSYNGYDSPTISGGRPCWGNIARDIENEFNTQDLYELVIDLIDYIRSPDTTAGYLSNNGDKRGGWDMFFKGAKKREKGYCFEKHEDQNEETREARSLEWGADTPTLTVLAGLSDSFVPQILDPRPSDPERTPPRRETAFQSRLGHVLYVLGLREEFITGVGNQITENMVPNEVIHDVGISLNGSTAELIVQSDRRVEVRSIDETTITLPQETRRRFLLTVDIHFLRPSVVVDLRRMGRNSMMF